ncbi:MAG: DNA polymerase III subunit chi, partial [Pseudomonadota bacterium]
TAPQEDAATSVDLLSGASDTETSNILSVTGLALVSGDDAGVTVNADSLDVDPAAYNNLAVGESEVITYSYTIADGNGPAVEQTATVTVTGENANDAQVRFAVDGAPLGALAGLERCVFMFNGRDDTAVADARQAWKAAKASGHAVTYWQQDSDGRWVKKAG